MADLLIKPLTGAGNTVTIQDQAGGAILTSENSGATLGSGVTIDSGVTFPAGHILQTLTVHKTDSEALSTSTWTAVPGMSLAITPSSASSKILISVSMQVAGDDNMYILSGRLYRDSTSIGEADASSSSPQSFFSSGAQPWSNYSTQHMVNFYLDSPNTTSASTYSIKVWDTRNNDVVYINRHHYTDGGSEAPRGTSSMVLQEIAQ